MNKLTVKDHLGYSIGSIGDSLVYTFIGSFLMFFLTTVAGIEPAAAGVITAVGAVWNAVFNPVIGYLSDKVFTRMGRRRPLIIGFSLPLALSIFLLFTDLPLHGAVKAIYYGLMTIMFWTTYTGYYVPYCALGAEYTNDYDDRTKLRLFAAVFNIIGTIFSMALPTVMVDILMNRGMSLDGAWSVVGLVMGVVATTSIIITFFASKKKDPPVSKPKELEAEKLDIKSLFIEYLAIARLKPALYLIIISIASLICSTLILSNIVYFFTYNLEFEAGEISAFLVTRSLFGLVLVPILGKTVKLLDKRGAVIFYYLLGAAGMIIMDVLSIWNMTTAVIYMLVAAVCTTIYWDIVPSFYYDLCDYDKAKNCKDRQGMIISFQGLVQAIASGMGTLILGFILQLCGFNGEAAVQSEHTMVWIQHTATVIPVLMLMLAAFMVYKYPISRKMHAQLLEEIAKHEAVQK